MIKLDKCPSAANVYCVSHSLDLCLLKASEVPPIRAAITVMREFAIFYTDLHKRLSNRQEYIDALCSESSRIRLKKNCATRWVEKQEAVMVFKELYSAIVASLDSNSGWPRDTRGKADIYL